MKPGLQPAPPGVHWRDAGPHDTEFRRELHHLTHPLAAVLPAGPDLTALLDLQYAARTHGYRQCHPHARALILETASPSGCAAGFLLVDDTSPGLVLVDFAVHPAYQRRGLGAAALTRLQVWAGARSITLNVTPGSPAENLYLRAGFTLQGASATHHTLRWTPLL
ncbi:GNAT family N-acetyltransferase [Deinococcus depolymerans]|uniref:N-acetyltransferase domain-containing protein n=1 Tax=Deinococcus depolymerans TaxID=392408 RepID=A0ABP3LJ25_9DEIO